MYTDRYLNLPKKLQRYVDNSWAPEFYEQVTCKINQDRFEVLYSNNKAFHSDRSDIQCPDHKRDVRPYR